VPDLENKTDFELARMRVEFNETSPQPILAEQEQQRRARLHQHELSIEILNTQTKMMKSTLWISAVATISAALLGAIVGAVLQYKLTQKPEVTTPILQKQVVAPASRPPK
jgi:hypothetical protein